MSTEESLQQELKRAKIIKEKIEQISEHEQTRFDHFVRSSFAKDKMVALILSVLGISVVDKDTQIIVGSLAKSFVGDVVAAAKECQENTSQPLSQEHIREAVRRLQNIGEFHVPRASNTSSSSSTVAPFRKSVFFHQPGYMGSSGERDAATNEVALYTNMEDIVILPDDTTQDEIVTVDNDSDANKSSVGPVDVGVEVGNSADGEPN